MIELQNYIGSVSSNCKNTKFVLSGYSQGAMVITNTIPSLDPNKITYVANFGDPKLYLPEGKGLIPDACKGKNLSPYREYAPNCHTSAGSLGAKKPYQESGWAGKIGLWCRDKDIICGAGVKITKNSSTSASEGIIGNAIASHVSYVKEGQVKDIAETIVKKLEKSFKSQVPVKNTVASTNRDTIILIDVSNSMDSHINSYKSEAKRLAKQTIDAGGRVALFTYNDLLYDRPTKLTDFGSSYDEFVAAINDIETYGGGDAPEDTLYAALYAMDTVSWRAGATKTIVIITDAGYHDPDRYGNTTKKVIEHSLEIDPVNIYVVGDRNNELQYTELISGTNGGFYNISSDLAPSTDMLLTRPSVVFPLDEYQGVPGDEFTFSATVTGEIASYAWDLNFDGIFETISAGPEISKTFTSEASGFIQLKVTDVNGNVSTGSAKLTVSSSLAVEPTLFNIHTNSAPGELSISYSLGENTAAVLVQIGDAGIGITSETQLYISDIIEDTTISLVPISYDGTYGTPLNITTNGNVKNLGLGGTTTSSGDKSTITNTTTSNDVASPAVPLAPNSGKR
ncbi:VWA domain-containing protein [Candidatus Saccharibacteria bacterium]|nr:VWA domain-containing protein [Candidatus Saccharibacteria bacterium]